MINITQEILERMSDIAFERRSAAVPTKDEKENYKKIVKSVLVDYNTVVKETSEEE